MSDELLVGAPGNEGTSVAMYRRTSLYAKQSDGTITPILVDATGKLVLSANVDIDSTEVANAIAAAMADQSIDIDADTITALNAALKATDQPVSNAALTELAAAITAGVMAVGLATNIAGEDIANDVMKTEQRYAYSRAQADVQVKGSAGFLHSLTFSCADAAPTAGSIIVYDSLTEAGAIIYTETFDTTAFRGYTVTLDVAFATGCYIGFTTTADVSVTASYR